jgi:alpha-N-acetylglucosaminidase
MKDKILDSERKRDGDGPLIDRRSFLGRGAASLSAGFVFLTLPWPASSEQAPVESSAQVGEISAARSLLNRLFPGREPEIEFELVPRRNGHDSFHLISREGKVLIKGSSVLALCSGLHWYLKYYCHLHLSWCGSRLDLPCPLPAVNREVRRESPFLHRVYFNYCSYGYTMA